MARVTFVKAARNDIEGTDIKKGESYYWWKFRFGGKHCSKTRPRRSQLTQSNYLSTLYDIEDRISELEASDSLPDEVQDIAEQLRELASECESSLENMPDALRDSPTGELLQERIDACNNAADELDCIDFESDKPDEPEEKPEPVAAPEGETAVVEPEEDETEDYEELLDQFWRDKLDEVQSVSIG